MRTSRHLAGASAISVAAVLWGLDGVVLTPRLFNLDVIFVVFILHALPFFLMSSFLFRQYHKLSLFTRADLVYFLLVAVTGGILGTLLIVKALFLVGFNRLSAIVLIQKLQPVFAVILAAIVLKECITGRFILWAVIALIGSYFLTFGFHIPDFSAGDDIALAAVYSFLAAASFGASTVFSKKMLTRWPFETVTFYRYGFTAFIMFFIVLVSGQLSEFSMATTQNWIIILIIGITTGSGAIFLYYWGLNRVKAIVATFCELFFPVSAVLFDYLVNRNTLSLVQWLAAIVLIFAVIRISRLRRE